MSAPAPAPAISDAACVLTEAVYFVQDSVRHPGHMASYKTTSVYSVLRTLLPQSRALSPHLQLTFSPNLDVVFFRLAKSQHLQNPHRRCCASSTFSASRLADQEPCPSPLTAFRPPLSLLLLHCPSLGPTLGFHTRFGTPPSKEPAQSPPP